MSQLQGHVGKWSLTWKSVPHGATGETEVEVQGKGLISVRWRRDAQGIWIETPSGVFGFDLDAQVSDEGRVSFQVLQRGSDREWNGLSFLRAGEEVNSSAVGAKKSAKIKAQMPGKIIRLGVKVGDVVQKDQSIAVMEAMKMENEIKAAQAGKISKVSVSEGQAVETGAELFLIDPA